MSIVEETQNRIKIKLDFLEELAQTGFISKQSYLINKARLEKAQKEISIK